MIESLMDLPIQRVSSRSSCSFTSSDESFGSCSSRSYKKVINDTTEKNVWSSRNKNRMGNHMETKRNEIETIEHQNHKSMVSIIKFLKKISSKKSENPKQLYRRPTEYFFVRGCSGLTIRVAKTPNTLAFAHRCILDQ